MYYFLVRIWTVFMFGLSFLFGYLLNNQQSMAAEFSLFLGCGTGLVLWLTGIVFLAAVLRPKQPRSTFDIPTTPRLNTNAGFRR
jgi:hypothetical protein